uniref:Uncharacterized protein n=1 Tax=Anguilla anguilla TaxID=7936 RepID=A0A0E9V8X1_ANGAN
MLEAGSEAKFNT